MINITDLGSNIKLVIVGTVDKSIQSKYTVSITIINCYFENYKRNFNDYSTWIPQVQTLLHLLWRSARHVILTNFTR